MTLGFSTFDFRALRALLLLTAIGVPALLIGTPVVGWIADLPLQASGVIDEPRDLPASLVGGASGLTWDGRVSFTIDAPSTADRLWALAPAALSAVVIGLAALLLHRLVTQIQRRQPFTAQSPGALHLLAGLIAANAVASPLLQAISETTLVRSALDTDGVFAFTINFAWLLLALLIAALAEAFRVGNRLREDADGLV